MDFSISPDVQALLRDVEHFLREEVFPLEPVFFKEGMAGVQAQVDGLRHSVKARGWWLPHLAPDHGGMGLSLVEFGLLSEVLGQTPLGHVLFNAQAPDAGNMEILARFGTPAHHQAWLEPLCTGQWRSCFAMTEPDHAGSNPVWLSTLATLEDDHWVLQGHKWFTTAADGAAFAIVMAVTDPEAPAHQRASQIIVPCDTPGFEHVRNIAIMGDEGAGYASHAEIRLNDCRVPKENLLGPRGHGFALAQTRLGPGRIHHCMRWLGICRRAFELMCARARTRQISPTETLADSPLIQSQVAQVFAQIEAAKWMVLHTAWRIEQQGAKAARSDISAIKFFVADVLQATLDRAIQLHGALGITDQTPLAYWWRHERGARIYDGPDEVHQVSLGRRLLHSSNAQGPS